jgi:hypothetical protein
VEQNHFPGVLYQHESHDREEVTVARPRSESQEETPKPRRRPATTLDGRENQMIALSVDLAEKQLREGTASAQVITHFLRLGTSRERLEQEKLKMENELLQTRAEAIASAGRVEELYGKALDAMRSYAGQDPAKDDDDDDY